MRRLTAALVALLLAVPALAADIPLAERRSGYQLMSPDTRAMQDDDTANPGMLWVLEGGGLWSRKTGAAASACADCHGDARRSMKGVAARYPAFDAARGRPVGLEQRINACRVERQQAPALAHESRELLALTAYVARQSRGMPIDVTIDARMQPFLDKGRALWERRQGQLNLACRQCHDDHWGAGSPAAWSPQRTRPAIRSIASSGRRWARSSAASATAWSACGRSRTSTAIRRWSSSSSI